MQNEPFRTPGDLGAEFRRLEAAAAEQTLSGALRRSLHSHTRNLPALIARIGCNPDLFSDWQEGLAELPGGVMDRLAQELGMILVESSK